MKKTFPILLTVLMVLSLASVAGYMFYQKTVASPGVPSIHFASESLDVPTNAGEEELLQGVTATDPEDGDVTASLMVEGMSRIDKDNNVKVSYVAFDSKNHMARAERTVHLIDYTDTRFSFSSALLFAASNRIDVLDRVTATDILDGDISHKVKFSLEGDSVSINSVGEYQVELRVTNSLGATAHLPVTVEVTQTEPNPAKITLDRYVLYLSKGAKFNAERHVVGYNAAGEHRTGADGLTISGEVDTRKAGVYTVDYTYGSADSRSRTRLIVVVE